MAIDLRLPAVRSTAAARRGERPGGTRPGVDVGDCQIPGSGEPPSRPNQRASTRNGAHAAVVHAGTWPSERSRQSHGAWHRSRSAPRVRGLAPLRTPVGRPRAVDRPGRRARNGGLGLLAHGLESICAAEVARDFDNAQLRQQRGQWPRQRVAAAPRCCPRSTSSCAPNALTQRYAAAVTRSRSGGALGHTP
jgi:hypothetical protein